MNDNSSSTATSITMPHDQAAALVAAGNLVSELWGDLAAGQQISLGDLDDKLEAAGLALRVDGVPVLADVLTDAVIDVGVALGRSEGDFGDDVDEAERAFAP